MKRYIFLIIILTAISPRFGFAQTAQQAAAAYANKNYPEAIELYQQLSKEQGVSSELYYNLGNAYYRNGDNGNAVLYYERSLRLNPRNKEAQANLDFLQTKLKDRFGTDENILATWIREFRNLLSSNGWTILGMVSFALFILGVAAYFFGKAIGLRKVGFFGGAFFAFVCIAANIFAYNARAAATDNSYAVVLSDSTMLSTVSRAPVGRNETAFVLHEGTKIKKLDSLRNVENGDSSIWYRIRTSDRQEVWIDGKAIEEI